MSQNKGKPDEPVATVPKMYVILLPYMRLHSMHPYHKTSKILCKSFVLFCLCQSNFSKHPAHQIVLPIQGPSRPLKIIQSHLQS